MTQGPRPIRVAVLNDYSIVVEGVAAVFSSQPERFDVVHTGSGSSADDEAALHGLAVDVVLIDPFATRRPLQARVAARPEASGPKWVVLSWFRSASSVTEALELGFAGYLSKTLDPESLFDAVEAIHRGEQVQVPDVAWPGPSPAGGWPGKEFGLTPREAEVLCLIAQGHTNQEISEQNHIGAETLKTHIRSAYRKIGVTRRSQAIVWALAHGLGPASAD